MNLMLDTEFPLENFRRALHPACPFIEWIAPLLPLLPFSKKREKGCLFTMFIYILNISYTFVLTSAFGTQKCALKNIKSALFLFSAPCPFFSLRGNSELRMFSSVQNFYLVWGIFMYIHLYSYLFCLMN